APSAHFGPTAERVHREQVCLEVCPSSNLQTAAAADLASHPVGPLHRLGFPVALSTDTRLMSRTRTSRAMLLAAQTCARVLPTLGPLHRLGFPVALRSDNRLMSRTRTSREMLLAAQTFDWGLADLEQIALTCLDARFAPAAQRHALRDEVVLPAFRAVGGADRNA